MKYNWKKALKREYSQANVPEYLPAARAAAPKRLLRRAVVVPVCVVLSCLLILGCAAAVVPIIIEQLNAGMLTENNIRIDYVPEGYKAISTKEELVALRERRSNSMNNYILMSDITFTDEDYAPGGICEGGWIPITISPDIQYIKDPDTKKTIYHYSGYSFMPVFNGNGHVIRNLKISPDGDRPPAGYYDGSHYGLFGGVSAYIINLGIEGCEINIDISGIDYPPDYKIYAGAVAGFASFIGGCYATDVSINVTLRDNGGTTARAYVGGLGGYVKYIDSCYSDADIGVVNGSGYELYAGGLVGRSYSDVTSYFTGSVTASPDDFAVLHKGDISGDVITGVLPGLFTGQAMDVIKEKAAAAYGGSGSFGYRRLIDMNFIERNVPDTDDGTVSWMERYTESRMSLGYTTVDISGDAVFYETYAPANDERNEQAFGELSALFGGSDEFVRFCMLNDLKSGTLYCYLCPGDSKMKQKDFKGFDFENIWLMRDGRPLLRVFEP